MYIDGQWTHAKSDAVFDVFNPATQDKISEVPDGGRDDANIPRRNIWARCAHHSLRY
jgi:acyl-CoA reductase-like NAD-dependent aldehyde dehydrogenase